jgi:hypothetical protein
MRQFDTLQTSGLYVLQAISSFVLVVATAVATWLAGDCAFVNAAERERQVKRARPPKWSADVVDAFFEDAREKLVAERPDYKSRGTAAGAAGDGAAAALDRNRSEAGVNWPKLIHAETIETEIKRVAHAVGQDVTTLSEFKGGKYQDCRRHFSVLAMLFAIAAEYDDTVRWQDSASGLRELFSRVARNCKVGTDATFREATQRSQDLADLVSGSRPQVPQAERTANWVEVSDRPPLMQRMNIAHEERLTNWLANEREFAKHRGDVLHEAQLVAAIAEVIGREGFEFWDDEQFGAYALELKQAASGVAGAAQQENYELARASGARMTKACADCHDGYRG